MARKNRSFQQRFQNASSFTEHLKLALEFYREPDVLSQHSPLATPYFLSGAAELGKQDNPPEEPIAWGRILCAEIKETAALLWGGPPPESSDELLDTLDQESQSVRSDRYDFLVLELNYFKQIVHPKPRNQAEIYNDILHISRTSHDRHLRNAVGRLSERLLQRVRPTVRLELPTLRSAFIGRLDQRRILQKALQDGQSVALVGVGGVGKTTLGTWLAQRWTNQHLFWYTVRPHFNDRLPSLLFALAYFLHRQGASSLWLQMVADSGKIEDANLALGLLLADLESLPHPPLLCFDEVDMLRAGDPDREKPRHRQILDLIMGLRHHCPLLLIGQRSVVECDQTFSLDKLARSEIEEWLQYESIVYTDDELTQLEAYTSGNPRLLMLCFALHRTLERPKLADTLVRLPDTPGLAPIWDRIRRRLDLNARMHLYALSVFRDSAPRDAWPLESSSDEPNAPYASHPIETLINHHLVQEDGAGGVTLLPTLRTLLYEELNPEQKESFHLGAAGIYANRGEITEAAYHLWRGDRPAQAIQLWYPLRQREIERGFAPSALEIFSQLSATRLEPALQRQLGLLRAELYNFAGKPDKAVDQLESIPWPSESPDSIDAMQHWGRALSRQGETTRALDKFNDGIEHVHHFLNQCTQLHVLRGQIYMQNREIHNAWREANRAQYYAQNLQGTVQDQSGNYAAAKSHYEMALSLAEELQDIQAIARTRYFLGIVASRQQDFQTAFDCFDQAIKNFQKTGNKTQEMYARTNQAACYSQSGEFRTAIEQAEIALEFYERINSPYWISLNASNLAEAHFELGNPSEAEKYGLKTIEQEEPDTFAYGLWILGRVRQHQQEFDEAVQLLTQAIQISEEHQDRWQQGYSLRTLGQVYAKQGKLETAREKLSTALELFNDLDLAAEAEATNALLKKVEL